MPTMPERMAVVETEVRTIKETTNETRSDVKLLVAWRNEERGARKQNRKLIAIGLTIASALVSAVVNILLKVVG